MPLLNALSCNSILTRLCVLGNSDLNKDTILHLTLPKLSQVLIVLYSILMFCIILLTSVQLIVPATTVREEETDNGMLFPILNVSYLLLYYICFVRIIFACSKSFISFFLSRLYLLGRSQLPLCYIIYFIFYHFIQRPDYLVCLVCAHVCHVKGRQQDLSLLG